MRLLKGIGIAVAAVALLLGLKFVVEYQKTLPIEGVVTDSVTGQPVEKVVVTALWHYRRPNLVDTTGEVRVHHAITDAQGRYRVPARRVNGLFDKFLFFELRLTHPLYATKTIKVYDQITKKYVAGVQTTNTVNLDASLLSLERGLEMPEDTGLLADFFGAERASWYRFLEDKYGVSYPMAEIRAAWERLFLRFTASADSPELLRLRLNYQQLTREMGKLSKNF